MTRCRVLMSQKLRAVIRFALAFDIYFKIHIYVPLNENQITFVELYCYIILILLLLFYQGFIAGESWRLSGIFTPAMTSVKIALSKRYDLTEFQ